MKYKFTSFVCLVGLSGCGDSGVAERHAKIIHDQVGRFAIVAAQEGFPAMVIDSATGCVMAISKDDSGEVQMSEVTFASGTNNCRIMRDLPTADTMEDLEK